MAPSNIQTMSQDLLQVQTFDRQKFLTWFKESGGWYNEQLVDVVSVPGMGYGAVAVKDIEVRLSQDMECRGDKADSITTGGNSFVPCGRQPYFIALYI